MQNLALVYETVFPEFKGGVERWFLELSSELVKSGTKVKYLNTSGIREERHGVQFVSMLNKESNFHISGKRTVFNTLQYTYITFKHFLKNKYDTVYVSSFPFLHIFVIKIALLIGRRETLLVCDWFEVPSKNFWEKTYGKILGKVGYFLQIITVKVPDLNFTYLDSTYGQVRDNARPLQKVIKLPGIIPQNLLTKNNLMFEDPIDICQIGRLTQDKRPLLSLQVVLKLKNKGWLGKFWIVGSGPLIDDIKDYIVINELSETVIVLDNANDSKIAEILSNCGLLFHPSRREGFGLVVIESACMGVPSVVIESEDNKIPELGINPNLVAHTLDIEVLSGYVLEGLKNRSKYTQECISWKNNIAPRLTSAASITEIARIINSEIESRKEL